LQGMMMLFLFLLAGGKKQMINDVTRVWKICFYPEEQKEVYVDD
jgi:hypothetical protein